MPKRIHLSANGSYGQRSVTNTDPQEPNSVPIPLDDPNALRDWCLETFINPDVERRRAAGQTVEPMSRWAGVQIVFRPSGGYSVRLNEEIQMRIKATTPTEPDGEIKLDDITSFHGVRPMGDDENCAHITFFMHKGKWKCAVGLAFNVPTAERHLEAAVEFLDAAADALDAGRLRVFVDNLHSATELMAKALIYTRGEEDKLQGGRNRSQHRKITETFQRLGKSGQVRRSLPKLHARLQNLRSSARYVAAEPLKLSETDARELLSEARTMQSELRGLIGEAFTLDD